MECRRERSWWRCTWRWNGNSGSTRVFAMPRIPRQTRTLRWGSRAGSLHPPPWTEAEDQRLRALRESGLFMREIGVKLGRDKSDVGRRCKELGIATARQAPRPAKPRLRTGPKPKAVTLPPLASLRED